MPAVARVAPLTPVDKLYSYRVPDGLGAEAVPGARVLVPFGPRTLTGVSADVAAAPTDKLKPLRDVLDDAPSFSLELLRLTRWIARYYVCAWGEVLKAALPAGATQESQRVVHRTGLPAPGVNGQAGRALAVLAEAGGSAPVATLEAALDGAPTASLLRRLERDGLVRIEKELAPRKAQVATQWHLRLADGVDPERARAALRGAKQQAVMAALARHAAAGTPEPRQADVLAETGAGSSTVLSLVEKRLVERVEREQVRTPFDDVPAAPPAHALHPAQEAALREIRGALDERKPETFLLHGITGSGKTEVYIQALKATLEAGRTGIVLVPEIALTPQTVRRFRAHFGDRIAVLHSRMSHGERYDAWRHLRSGRFTVAIGPRSAVFAPLRNVGLIVVDEEHEGSYKQFDPAPRYHARDVAVMRAHLEGAVCVLGSATPSLETVLNTKRGKYRLLKMPERVPVPGKAAAPLPDVRIVDLTRERKVRRLRGALSHPLREAISDRLERTEGVILLQNRRGYSPVVTCEDCGYAPHCRDCAVTLTYHKSGRHLRCHYCGRVEQLPPACPQCGSADLQQVGAGTQRVEEELAEVFPHARVLRMDLDTTARKDAHRKILDRFGRGEADVLIGTQMVAKGLDFARVTLVGVVDADTGLLLPDFRAAERTFQLLMQVAGRAGRGALRGEVLLQTRSPEHPALQCAARHDFGGFLRAELPDRRTFSYPPFGRLVGVEFKGVRKEAVEETAERWTALLKRQGPQHEVLGPQPAFIGRVKRQYRVHTIVKAALEHSPYVLPRVVHATNARFGAPPKGVRINVDVDPLGLL
ncbi:MAG: primosomal protein N' [Rhodothermales bacterium]|nr:primosomal protein N' [Rhodothermales bacterium]